MVQNIDLVDVNVSPLHQALICCLLFFNCFSLDSVAIMLNHTEHQTVSLTQATCPRCQCLFADYRQVKIVCFILDVLTCHSRGCTGNRPTTGQQVMAGCTCYQINIKKGIKCSSSLTYAEASQSTVYTDDS